MRERYHKGKIALLVIWSVIAAIILGVMLTAMTTDYFSKESFGFSSGPSQEIKRDFDQSNFNAISVYGAAADVQVRAASDEQVHVSLKYPQKDKSSPYAITTENKTLKIQTSLGWHWILDFGGTGNRYTITVAIPADYKRDLEIHSDSGDVSLPNQLTLHRLMLQNVSGDSHGGHIEADYAEIQSTSGDARLTELKATEYAIKQVSGDFSTDSLSGRGKITETSGDLKVGVEQLSGSLEISSVSGDIRAALKDGNSAKTEMHSVSGDLHSDYPMTYADSHHASAIIGSNTSTALSIHTTSGDISLTRSK